MKDLKSMACSIKLMLTDDTISSSIRPNLSGMCYTHYKTRNQSAVLAKIFHAPLIQYHVNVLQIRSFILIDE